MNILILGGAGYIGSHMSKMLTTRGYNLTVLDNLSTGFSSNVKYGRLVRGDLSDIGFLDTLFSHNKFDAVMHFAAFSLVAESVTDPARYYQNNVTNTLNLLDVMIRYEVSNLIFSSTAATFGDPEYIPIDEAHPQLPINAYGASKLMIERILKDYALAYGLNSVSLRYFNACGADPDGELGECHDPETHLIPLILQTASGRRESIKVFGRNYDTDDGTCVRDYIHVCDLCSAHALALDYVMSGVERGALAFNLGNGAGFSVQQVIDVVKKVVAIDGRDLTIEDGPRRAGDPAILVADASRAKTILGWKPVYNNLETIVKHAWVWEKKLARIVEG